MESRSEAFIERRPYCDKGLSRRPIDGQKRWTFLDTAFAST